MAIEAFHLDPEPADAAQVYAAADIVTAVASQLAASPHVPVAVPLVADPMDSTLVCLTLHSDHLPLAQRTSMPTAVTALMQSLAGMRDMSCEG